MFILFSFLLVLWRIILLFLGVWTFPRLLTKTEPTKASTAGILHGFIFYGLPLLLEPATTPPQFTVLLPLLGVLIYSPLSGIVLRLLRFGTFWEGMKTSVYTILLVLARALRLH